MGLPTIRLVHLYCVVLGATAMFFWVWAILNVLNQKAAFDLGMRGGGGGGGGRSGGGEDHGRVVGRPMGTDGVLQD